MGVALYARPARAMAEAMGVATLEKGMRAIAPLRERRKRRGVEKARTEE